MKVAVFGAAGWVGRAILDNLSGRIFNAQYIPVRESNQVIGRVAKKNIAQGEAIQYVDLEN